ncbi:hypothetical protein KAR91_41335 [Candidatus Pacearchaeota archaeon]|nr:hypothetical protein [Candidatus Pacearchaeota archaeon]
MSILEQNLDDSKNMFDDLIVRQSIIDTEVKALRVRIRNLVLEERKVFTWKNFKLNSVMKTDETNYIIRYTSKPGISKHRKQCYYWAVWNQYDNDGQFIQSWSCPALKQRPEYPDFIKQNFLRYVIRTDRATYTPPPWWIRPGSKVDTT